MFSSTVAQSRGRHYLDSHPTFAIAPIYHQKNTVSTSMSSYNLLGGTTTLSEELRLSR